MLSENSLDLILSELEDGWDHEWLDEGKEIIFIGFTGIDDGFLLELSEEDKGWLGGSEFGSTGGIKVVDESNFLLRIGKFDVSLSVESIIEVGSSPYLAPKKAMVNLSAAVFSLRASQVTSRDGGPVFLRIHETMASAVLPPW